MSTKKSPWVLGSKPMPQPVGSEVVNVLLEAELATGDLTANDIIIMGAVPADCVIVDAVFAADDLDSDGTPALVLAFGTINGDQDDLTTTLQADAGVGQAANAVRATLTPTILATTGGTSGQEVGYKVTTAPATAAAGTVMLSLSYRATAHGG